MPPHLFLLSIRFIAEHDVIGYGISLLSLWVSCPGSVPSQHPAHLQLTGLFRVGWGGVAGEAASMLWERCSAVAKTLVRYQRPSSYNSKAQHYEGYYGES